MESVVEVKNLKKTYKDLTAVDNITFDVKKGEILGLDEKLTIEIDNLDQKYIDEIKMVKKA